MQVFPRFRGSECPGKYPLYNIRKEKFEKQRFSRGFHARPDLEFYRGPRAGGCSLLPIRVVLAVPPVARDWENRISTINPLQPVSFPYVLSLSLFLSLVLSLPLCI